MIVTSRIKKQYSEYVSRSPQDSACSWVLEKLSHYILSSSLVEESKDV